MIADYVQAPNVQARMRACCAGPYLDDLSSTMAREGFQALTIAEHLRTVVQLARWAERRGVDLADWDERTVAGFGQHLARRRVIKRARAVSRGKQFLVFLRTRGVIAPGKPAPTPRCAPVLEQFADWMVRHRGLSQHTIRRYRRILEIFLSALGEETAAYDVTSIRQFIIDHLGHRGRGETRETVTAIRSFLRFLAAHGRVRRGIECCVPTVPEWRLSSLPRYLEAADVERVVKSCDLSTGHGLRDHAILLLLSRLGLRAGDIVAMRIDDIDWRQGTLRLQGKSHRETVLPLPQDVGNALVAYVRKGRPRSDNPRLFLTVLAPTRPFATSAAVSDLVRFALGRAGIKNPPTRGAHLLRHSAATAMLRSGSTLETIATVLRHRSSETTAHYAKVDQTMLQSIAQSWPGDASC